MPTAGTEVAKKVSRYVSDASTSPTLRHARNRDEYARHAGRRLRWHRAERARAA
jgi:hypothetical protein